MVRFTRAGSVMESTTIRAGIATDASMTVNKVGARNRVEVAIWAHETGRVQARH